MGNQRGNERDNDKPGQQGDASRDAAQGQQSQQNVHGEGNYAATRDYNERTKRFVESGKVEQAARDAAPDSEAEALQLAAAEAEGKSHAKGEDPALSRKSRPDGRGGPATATSKPGAKE